MKKKLILMMLIIIGVGYISCRKPTEEDSKNYREKWIGIYECEKHVSHIRLGVVIVDVTMVGDSLLNITERSLGYGRHRLECDVKVNGDGGIGYSNNWDTLPSTINGSFYTESLFLRSVYAVPNMDTIAFLIDIYNGKKLKKIKQ